MPIRRAPTVVSFDADVLLESLLERLGDGLRTFAEYDHGDYQVLYASDRLLEGVGGEDAFAELADRYYNFVHLDFVEREVFADLSPAAGAVGTYITRLDNAMFVRYLVGDEGVFFSVAPDTHAVPLLERLDELVS
ncbi:hypothetical protein [Halorarius litoreus]|uniref:hypothetical protein n=1 Tax=Halorarius litoreus TaxID=2962676 RepID=UPI0020CB92A8|nr:hypothetical protein [Halorarius litoreus]